MIRKLLVLAAALVVLSAAPAAAQYDETEVLSVSDDSIAPGASIDVSCSGLQPGTTYTVTFAGEVVGSGIVPASETVAGTFTVSSDQAPGTYTLTISSGAQSCSAQITVLDVPPVDNPDAPGFDPGSTSGGTGGTGGTGTGGTGALPRTGSSTDVTSYAAVGAGLLAVGGISLMAGRRRRPAHA